MRPIVGPWYKVTLPFKESGAGKVMLLQDAFDVAFMANNLLENAAMFGSVMKTPRTTLVISRREPFRLPKP